MDAPATCEPPCPICGEEGPPLRLFSARDLVSRKPGVFSVAPEEADLRVGDLAGAGFDDGSFDVVTLYHCLEYAPDPVATLRGACEVLRPGGLLVAEVSNFGGLWRRVCASLG